MYNFVERDDLVDDPDEPFAEKLQNLAAVSGTIAAFCLGAIFGNMVAK